jgi:crotonobetainyl-CoA:carnitine CoA-transferase CaiB-like acyl-CoA transferase
VTATSAFSGIRVIDLSHGLASPSASRILAALGAEVIKIEMTGDGEFTRGMVPYVFRSHNRGKRSFAVDLKSPEGAELVRRLAATADVFVHGQRPGFVEKIGLDRETLTALNPKLIYAFVCGFGTTGPWAQRRAIDMLIQAESGLAAAQSGLLGNLSFVDTAAGLALSNGILAALLERATTGRVQHVEVSLLDTATYLQAAPLAEFSATGVSIDQDSYWNRYATVGLYESADGPIYVAGYWNKDWTAICHIIGRPELITDPRYVDPKSRGARADEVRAIVNDGFRGRSRNALLAALEDNGVMAGAVRSYREVLDSPQVKANNGFVEETDEQGATTLFARPPYRLVPDLHPETQGPPDPGDATIELLREIGGPADEISRFVDAGVVSGRQE